MKRILTLLPAIFMGLCLNVSPVSLLSQNNYQPLFQKIFGEADAREYCHWLEPTSDGGCIFAGTYNHAYNGKNHAFTVKMDSIGREEWGRIFDGPVRESGNAVFETRDGGYMFIGETESYGQSQWGDLLMIKLDAYGDTVWSQTLGGQGYDYPVEGMQTADGGEVILASTRSFGSSIPAPWLFKLDKNGGLAWSRIYRDTAAIEPDGLVQTRDGGYAILASNENQVTNSSDIMLLKTDGNGIPIWGKNYTRGVSTTPIALDEMPDGGFVMTFDYLPGFSPNASTKSLLMRVDSLGDTLWTRNFMVPYEFRLRDVKALHTGEILILGQGNDGRFNGQDKEIILGKLDDQGEEIWVKWYDMKTDFLASIPKLAISTGGQIIMAAEYKRLISFIGNPPIYEDIWINRVDANGENMCFSDSGYFKRSLYQPLTTNNYLPPVATGGVFGPAPIPNRPLTHFGDPICTTCPDPIPAFTYVNTPNGTQFTDISTVTSPTVEWHWDFGDGTTDSVQNPLHLYPNTILRTVCLVVCDSCGSDTICTLVFPGQTQTGLEDSQTEPNISLFPNPGTHELWVEGASIIPAQIRILDLQGKILRAEQWNQGEKFRVDTQNLPEGLYLIEVRTSEGNHRTFKWVKQ